jgi:hypothetical protein
MKTQALEGALHSRRAATELSDNIAAKCDFAFDSPMDRIPDRRCSEDPDLAILDSRRSAVLRKDHSSEIMKILYLHGWQSVPGGVKPSYLVQQGHELLEPALPDEDFAASVQIAETWHRRHGPDVVVGSSRGGAVAANMDSGTTPLVLLCPAWKRWGSRSTVKTGTLILHAPGDEVVPYADSEELIRNSGLPETALLSTGSEHRLADPASLAQLAAVLAHRASQH